MNDDLLKRLAERAGALADLSIDDLRAGFPILTGSRAELVRLCKEYGYTRGQMLTAILLEEFQSEGV